MEAEFERSCNDGRIAGMCVASGNKSGSFRYQRAFGVRSIDPAIQPPEARPPFQSDTLLRIASATKLITSIAAMQCVDRGLIGLDDDVRVVDPDLKGVQLLTGFDGDKPILTAPKEKLTLRRLLSHSSGFNYDVLSELIPKWREINHMPVDPLGPKLTDRFLMPQVTEPGTDWCYSPSIDWAGRIVERVANVASLEDFVQANIVGPLGLKKMSFFPQKHPELLTDHAEMIKRNNDTGKLEHSSEKYWTADPEDAFGGMGLYTTTEDCFEVLLSLLKNDERLISQGARDEMFSPQLTSSSKQGLKRFLSNPMNEAFGMGGNFPVGSERDHTLAGMYLVEDPGDKLPRRPGTIAWMGLPNVYWFIDPTAGICGIFASQLKPSDDPPVLALSRLFEKTMYERMLESAR